MGYAGAESWMTGHMYLFHNTILNVDDMGCNGLGGSGRVIHRAVTRNNVLHVRSDHSRSISTNGRGNAALRKLGALQEGVLRRSFHRNGRYLDQILWSILKDDWRRTRPAAWGARLH